MGYVHGLRQSIEVIGKCLKVHPVYLLLFLIAFLAVICDYALLVRAVVISVRILYIGTSLHDLSCSTYKIGLSTIFKLLIAHVTVSFNTSSVNIDGISVYAIYTRSLELS